jgi:TIR domain
MHFEQNLFISYAHIDNEPLTPGEKGWVTRFHATLKAMLSMRMGRDAKIWRDEKLQGNDVFSDEIVARFKQSAALVSIVTSRYLNSEWCTREAREFCQSALQNGGLAFGNKSRVFKVIKTPVDTQESLPAPMKELLGYEFFTEEDGAPLEFDPAYGQKYAERYNKSVGILAFQIAQLFKILESGAAAGSEPQAPGKPAVYLAECGYDQKQARELLDGELKRLGYPVLPDKQLPADEAQYVAAVEGMLARCALSIHLVGESLGFVPDGPTAKSAGIHQNELAVARCRSGGLKRLIWLPQGTRSGHPSQQAFIEALHQDAQVQFGADLITADIEQLRGAMHATLKKIEQPEPRQPEDTTKAQTAAGNCGKLMYFILDEKDRKTSVPLRKLCKQLGFEVAVPAFDGDASQIRKNNQQLLESCDAALLFYGAGDESWKRAIDSELKKMAGYRAGKPPPATYTYLAEPRTSDKEDLIDMEEPGLIDGLGGFVEAAVAEFINPSKP